MGQGIHWESIDEDISVEGLLAGKPSAESQSSFATWLPLGGFVQTSVRTGLTGDVERD
jgi:hypothetical protein